MISDFIKSEPDLTENEIPDKLISDMLSMVYRYYEEGLNPGNWNFEGLDQLEKRSEATNPVKHLLKINTETQEVTDRITDAYVLEYLYSHDKFKGKRKSDIYSYNDRPLYNLKGDYSLICAVLALRILIHMKESSKVNAAELVTATKLIQAIHQCDLLRAMSDQVLSEQIRHYDTNQIYKKSKCFDEDPINDFKKKIVQSKTIDYLWEDDSVSIYELIKLVGIATIKEIDELRSAGKVPDADIDSSISSSVLKRWITEAKTVFDNAAD